MLCHVIIWKLKSSLSESEKAEIRKNAKKNLEALVGQIPGLISMRIETEGIASSTGDMMLLSSFEKEEDFIAYKTHPAHVHAADTYVRPYTEQRSAFDYFKED